MARLTMRFLDRTTSTPDTSVRGLTRSRPSLMEMVDLQTIFADAVPGDPLLDRDDQDRGDQIISVHGVGGVTPQDYTRGGGGRGSGVSDHGILTGLADDDHPNYLNLSRGDNRYYQKTLHISTSAGSAQAGKPIVLDADGDIDDSMIPLSAKGSLLVGEGTQADRLSVGDDETILVADATQDLGMSWVTPAVLAATLDHGLLLGLNDADHNAVYYTETELDAGQLDNRYFTETEHLNTSAGAGDAGKPIKLDADGHIDATMINDSDVDHGGLGGLTDEADHPYALLIDGTRTLTGPWAANNDITGLTKLVVDSITLNSTDITSSSSMAISASSGNLSLLSVTGVLDFLAPEFRFTPIPGGVDILVTFLGSSNQGTLAYMEDEDEFRFSAPVLAAIMAGGAASAGDILIKATTHGTQGFINLGSEVDAGAHTIGFTQQAVSYASGTTTVDWKLSNKAKMTFGAGNITTFAFTNPTNPCNLLLIIKQDGTGSRVVSAWDADILWVGGTAPTLSTGANDIDVLVFYWDGTNYFGQIALDFS